MKNSFIMYLEEKKNCSKSCYSFTYTVVSFSSGFLHLEQIIFFFISMGDMCIGLFLSKDMLRMKDRPKLLQMTWKTPWINHGF